MEFEGSFGSPGRAAQSAEASRSVPAVGKDFTVGLFVDGCDCVVDSFPEDKLVFTLHSTSFALRISTFFGPHGKLSTSPDEVYIFTKGSAETPIVLQNMRFSSQFSSTNFISG